MDFISNKFHPFPNQMESNCSQICYFLKRFVKWIFIEAATIGFYKKCVLKKLLFKRFTGKYLCQSLFVNEIDSQLIGNIYSLYKKIFSLSNFFPWILHEFDLKDTLIDIIHPVATHWNILFTFRYNLIQLTISKKLSFKK